MGQTRLARSCAVNSPRFGVGFEVQEAKEAHRKRFLLKAGSIADAKGRGFQGQTTSTASAGMQKVLEKLRTGEMPPKGMPRPNAAELKLVAQWIEREFDQADRLAKPKRVGVFADVVTMRGLSPSSAPAAG